MMPKKELIRVVRTPSEEVIIDLTGKKAGRGAYLCGKVGCFKLAKKSKALDRALKQPVSSELYDQLEQDFIAVHDDFIAGKKNGDDDDE
jgi:predicted RNA-binding protein YlxR (DUF448 family)